MQMEKRQVEQVWNNGKSEHNKEKFGSSEWGSERLEVEQVMTYVMNRVEHNKWMQ